MPVYTKELIDAISIIAEKQELRVCVKNSAKGGLIVGASALVGGLLLGPVGLAIGGTLGGLGAYENARGTYKSIALIIRNDLTDSEKEMICKKVVAAFKDIGITDVNKVLLALLVAEEQMQKMVVRELFTFFTNQMKMQIID